jgi:hypothetical protein
MHDEERTVVGERRSERRGVLDGTVTVRFAEQQIVGPGQNISHNGVFFVADGALQVLVELPGDDGWRRGEVMRVQSMGEGKIGIAVRFTGDAAD